jgi:hypothetical protein
MFERDSEKARRVVFARYQASEARFRRDAIDSESRTPRGPRLAGQPKAASGGGALHRRLSCLGLKWRTGFQEARLWIVSVLRTLGSWYFPSAAAPKRVARRLSLIMMDPTEQRSLPHRWTAAIENLSIIVPWKPRKDRISGFQLIALVSGRFLTQRG